MDGAHEIREQLFQFFRSQWIEHLGKDSPLQGAQSRQKIFDLDNEALSHSVFAKEVRGAMWAFEANKALGSDRFSPFFYRQYGSIVDREVVEVVQLIFGSRGIPEE